MNNFEIYNDDCLSKMNELIENGIKVDCLITDPPYEFKKGGFGGGQKEISKRSLKSDVDNELFHIEFDKNLLNKFDKLCKKTNIIMFGTEDMIFKATEWAKENNKTYTWLVWNKTNPTPLCNNRYLNNTEWIIHIREKGVPIYGNYHTKGKVYTSPVNSKDKKLFGHPTIKPLELMEKILINHTLEEHLVLDPFMGSGSTGVACKNLKRNFIGIELNQEYFLVAKKRIFNEQENKEQLELF